MSACAVTPTPETYSAWRYVEANDAELHEREEAEIARGEEELGLLLADLEASPTVTKLEQYLKRLFEIQCFTQRSIARKLEQYQHEDACLAHLHLEGRPEEKEDSCERAKLATQVEEGKRSYAENAHRLDVVNGLIAKRRAWEQELFEGEADSEGRYSSDSEQDEHIIRTKLGQLSIHE